MPDLNEIPTLELILDAKRYLTETWSSTHQSWIKRDKFYRREYAVWDNPTHRRTRGNMRPGRPTAIIDHAADAALQFVPTFHRDPVGDSDTHVTAADNVENGMAAVILDSAMQEPVQTWKQLGRFALHLGYFVLDGPLWSEKKKPVEPQRKSFDSEEDFNRQVAIYKVESKFFNPIRIRATHPARILLDPDEKEPEMGVKLGRMRNQKIYDLSRLKSTGRKARKHAVLFDLSDKNPWGWTDTIDFWTSRWHTFIAAGKIVYREKNMGGFVPFAHAFTGFGMEPTDLLEADPVHLAVGLLDPVMDDIQMEAQRINAMHTLMTRRAFASLGTKNDPFELQQTMAEQGIVEGEEGDVWLLPSPAAEGWMFKAGQDTADDIELSTYAKPISGGKEPGVVTVGQQQILSNAATRKFAAPAMQVEDMGSLTASRVLRLVDIGGDIGAKGTVLRRSDIYHTYNITAHFELLDPVLDMQRLEQGITLVREKLIGWEDFHTDYRRTQDLSSVREHLWEDIVRAHPGVAAQFAQAAADRIGLGEEFSRANEEETAALAEGGEIPGQAEFEKSSLTGNNGPSGLRMPLTDSVVKPGRV